MNTASQWNQAGPHREEMQRALNVAGAGSSLLQTFINRVVQALTLREHGAQAVLPRRPGSGNAAYINRRTPGATSGQWLADTTEPTEDTGAYTQVSFTYRTLVTRGKVTRKLQATGRTYGDILAMEITEKASDFADIYETALIVGDSSTDANQINGLITLINAVSTQVVANTTATGGDALDVDKLDETIDSVKGAGNRADLAILASFKGRRLLNTALQANQQFNDKVEIEAGFRVRSYDDIPIVTSTEIPDVLVWNGTDGAVTAYSGGATTAVIVVNTRFVWIEELTPATVLPLAKSSSQFDQFDIFSDSALVFANTLGGAILGGLA